ncbi:MAG: phospho-N-acetylmuramoyl-pentapeptide-transferase [Flavobacteriales bacterium]|nr:phospho-N-acetylmuramoyl-pentapeptide-transferase [Flavobacteriales bacterium]MCW8913847.1 phospho-N-acetylmuramoyl-pentapeptide-transferase [Flavobacteriales bacterium]MCW8937963.1 phospho-N-acetylmuramoyl-pentapeptide-transferase [Flavobacteriales bacterium]MCW8941011.1 phospho-N-acetylmuramoyl-pentapeptide-transferase [Flavobacteriales bacterium]MCW8968412.1 phospho-N-acetylmuramoyl-pentapeptide-transferase [Flavobacteriales bacterium]
MLYYLFNYLNKFDFPGAGVFEYISFRAAMAVIVSLVISMIFGKKIIQRLQLLQVGEIVRDLGLEGQMKKQGTPTMGGLIILASILIPTLLFAKLDNIYIILMIISTILLGLIGFIDDYIKVFKKNKAGLAGKFKVMGQVGVGIIVGTILYFNEDVVVKQKVMDVNAPAHISYEIQNDVETKVVENYTWKEVKSTLTTIPFFKNNEFDYASLTKWAGKHSYLLGGILFVLIVIVIITAVSNGANMTDGLDGLATGTSAIIGVTLAIFAYVSGNTVFAEYLNIMYIPESGELVIFIAAFVGACVGFLWYNSYPAQVFMGDTGSLALGGIIAVFSLAVRKELLIPLLCGVFLIENLSVMIQVGYFKYTKKRYGEGRRVFLMAPLHHHFQKKNMHEAKIVARFWIIGIMLALLTFVTLKLR